MGTATKTGPQALAMILDKIYQMGRKVTQEFKEPMEIMSAKNRKKPHQLLLHFKFESTIYQLLSVYRIRLWRCNFTLAFGDTYT